MDPHIIGGNIMKKTLAVVLTMGLALSFVGCGSKETVETGSATDAVSTLEDAAVAAESVAEEVAAEVSTVAEAENGEKAEGVMTYEEYAAAEVDSEVVVETYVQAKQSWWEDAATFYTQDEMEHTSSTIWLFHRKIMISLLLVQRLRLQVLSLNGQANMKS